MKPPPAREIVTFRNFAARIDHAFFAGFQIVRIKNDESRPVDGFLPAADAAIETGAGEADLGLAPVLKFPAEGGAVKRLGDG